MSISSLQQEGFTGCLTFMNQVGIQVRELSLYYDNQGRITDPNSRFLLGQVIRNPNNFGFHTTIIADDNWPLSFDAWSEDPAAADNTIRTYIELVYTLMTQIIVDAPK
jgi:hypothetical protein